MTGTAITMMIVAMLVVWGGLIASILFMRSRPEVLDGPYEDPDLVGDDEARARLDPHIRDT